MARGDFEGDSNIDTGTWNAWLNSALLKLFRLVARQAADHFLTSSDFTLAGATDTQALPSDFFKLRALDYLNGGEYENVDRFQFRQRNDARRRYRVQGTVIRITPLGAAAGSYRLWYTQTPTVLSGDSDQIPQCLDVYAEFIALEAAIRGRKRQKRESMELQAELDALTRDIASSADDRDGGTPDKVTDVYGYADQPELPGPA